MNLIERQVVYWLDSAYPDRDVPDRYKKLGEEFGELGEALMRGHDGEALKEAADCAIVLIDLVSLLGRSLEKEVFEKLKELKARPEHRSAAQDSL